jgi:hypothetical protein
MSGSTTRTDKATEKAWTVFGKYRDEEFPDGGILEGDFAGVFYAATADEAVSLAHAYETWLEWGSESVVPGAVQGVMDLVPLDQMEWGP